MDCKKPWTIRANGLTFGKWAFMRTNVKGCRTHVKYYTRCTVSVRTLLGTTKEKKDVPVPWRLHINQTLKPGAHGKRAATYYSNGCALTFTKCFHYRKPISNLSAQHGLRGKPETLLWLKSEEITTLKMTSGFAGNSCKKSVRKSDGDTRRKKKSTEHQLKGHNTVIKSKERRSKNKWDQTWKKLFWLETGRVEQATRQCCGAGAAKKPFGRSRYTEVSAPASSSGSD